MIDRRKDPEWYGPYHQYPWDVSVDRLLADLSYDEWTALVDDFMETLGANTTEWLYIGEGEYVFKDQKHAAMFRLRFAEYCTPGVKFGI